jgi:hypothetical protein
MIIAICAAGFCIGLGLALVAAALYQCADSIRVAEPVVINLNGVPVDVDG